MCPSDVRASAVIVNWNTRELLPQCLDSLHRAEPASKREDFC
jgi:GT2 family glycosyltransferase